MVNQDIRLSEVAVEYEDLKEFLKAVSYNNGIKIWRAIGVVYIFLGSLDVLLMTFVFSPGAARTGNVNLLSWDLISRLGGVLLMVFLLFIMPWFVYPMMVNRSSRKTYENNRFLRGPQSYMFSELGFKVESENGEAKYKWDDLTAVKEIRHYLALYISRNQAFILPRRFLENRADIIGLVKGKVSGRYSVVKRGLQIY